MCLGQVFHHTTFFAKHTFMHYGPVEAFLACLFPVVDFGRFSWMAPGAFVVGVAVISLLITVVIAVDIANVDVILVVLGFVVVLGIIIFIFDISRGRDRISRAWNDRFTIPVEIRPIKR